MRLEPSEKAMMRRAKAAFWGAAVGDAFGKMTEGYWPPEVVLRYGGRVTDFHAPISAAPDREYAWACAEVTDDTRFNVLVAESIVACNGVNEDDVIRRILAQPVKGWPGWEEFTRRVRAGGRMHRTGNGAPTRVVSVGILHPADQIKALVEDVHACCRATHDSRSAIAAACAVAAAYSAILEGKDKEDVLQTSLEAAILGDRLGEEDYLPSVPRRIEWLQRVRASAQTHPKQRPNPGFSAWEGSICALYLFLKHESAREGIIEAANWGGDADSIGSMAGGMLAAGNPHSLPEDWQMTVQERNGLDLDRLAEDVLRVRQKRAPEK